MFIAPFHTIFFNFFTMVSAKSKIKNTYQSAYNNAIPYYGSDNEPDFNDTVIDGYNYGSSWSEGDQAKYDLYLKSMEFDNSLALMDYQNEYNSPKAQLQRMREAGLNPDFQNVQSNSSSSSDVSSPSAPAGESNSSRAERYGNMAMQFFQLIPQAIQMYSSLKGSLLDLDLKSLQVDKSISDLAFSDAVDSLSTSDLKYGSFPIDALSNSDLVANRNFLFDNNGRRGRRFSRQYHFELTNLLRGNQERLKAGVYNRSASSSQARMDFINLLSKYGFNMTDDVLINVLREYNSVIFSTDKKNAEIDNKRADNDVVPQLMQKANNLIDSKRNVDVASGYLLYFLASLLQSGIRGSVQRDSKGKFSGSIGF